MKFKFKGKLVIFLVIVLMALLATGCGDEKTNKNQKPKQQSTGNKAKVSPKPEELTLTSSEKETWINFFNDFELQFLPYFKEGDTLDNRKVIDTAAFYVLSMARANPQGEYKVEKAKRENREDTRIKAEDVEKAAKSLLNSSVNHQSSGAYDYEDGYYWEIPKGVDITFYRITKFVDNKDNTYTIDIDYYKNLFIEGKDYHTQDGGIITSNRNDFESKLLDSSVKIVEKPERKSRLKVKKVVQNDSENYLILENINVTD